MYIYEYENWTHFTYDSKEISALLENCHIAQGRLLSKMEALGLSQKEDKILESISADVIKSSEIEGFLLNKEQVRSSIARRLGLQKQIAVNTDRNVDAVVEMMLDATQNYEKPLTKERLFAWHACLFPTGYSGKRSENETYSAFCHHLCIGVSDSFSFARIFGNGSCPNGK